MHRPITRVEQKRPAPNKFPIEINRPPSDPPAENEDIISGAPFAKARRVTPDNVSLILSASEIFVSTGVK
jgi:hypothetical protein